MNTTIKKLLFISLLFSFFAKAEPILQYETEASYTLDCGEVCKKTENLQLLQCITKINSKECQAVPVEDRANCHKEKKSVLGYAHFAGDSLVSCGSHLLGFLNAQLVFDLLWSVVEFSVDLFSDTKTRQQVRDNALSVKNYLAGEFYSAYEEAEGSQLDKMISSAQEVVGESFSDLWQWIINFVSAQYKSFTCHNSAYQTGFLCSVLVGMLIPLPSGSLLSYVQLGLKGKKMAPESIKKVSQLVTNSMKNFQKIPRQLSNKQLHSMSTQLSTDVSQHIVKTLKSAPQSVQKELSYFVKKLDKQSLKIKIENNLKKINKEASITPSFLLNSTVGAIISEMDFRLSTQATLFLTKEMSNMLKSSYIDGFITSF